MFYTIISEELFFIRLFSVCYASDFKHKYLFINSYYVKPLHNSNLN